MDRAPQIFQNDRKIKKNEGKTWVIQWAKLLKPMLNQRHYLIIRRDLNLNYSSFFLKMYL